MTAYQQTRLDRAVDAAIARENAAACTAEGQAWAEHQHRQMLAGCLMRAMCPHGMNVLWQQTLDELRAMAGR